MLLLLSVLVTGIVTLIEPFQDKESFAAVEAAQKKRKPERLEDTPSLLPIDAMPEEMDGKKNATI